MKDVPHHLAKFLTKVKRSNDHEDDNPNVNIAPEIPASDQQLKKQKKLSKKKEHHEPPVLSDEEKNKKLQKRTPVLRERSHKKR